MKIKLSNYQFFSVVFNFIIFSSILMAPALTVAGAKQDGWISMLLATIIGLLLMALYLFLFKKYNYPSLFELMDKAAGKWGGTIINLLIIFYAIHLAALVVRNLSNFMVVSVIPYSHPWVYQIMILVLVSYTAVLGVKKLFLVSELLFPLVILFLLGSLLLVTEEFDFLEIKPIFNTGFAPIFEGAYPTLGFPFIEVLILSTFLQYMEKKEKAMMTFLSGIAVGGLILSVTVFFIIGDEGAYMVGRESYPTYSVLRDIDFITVFERVEILMAVAWINGLFVKITACFLVAMIGLQHLAKSSNYYFFVIPIGVLIWAMSNHLHKSIMDFNNFVNTSWTLYWFSLYFFIILIFLIGFMRKVKVNTS
ncbi:endospore germination permease [Halobacillus sp. Marseille-Q1614]|uniref:GerAB/ArcD/ProY family transporter n=1 Tax=Halobacillus sp. Marseille-Q1614 TaxID=2709134 RepID=UPI00157100F9|nr:endospore germination permease [Halobacillus sp. Marseille-Q1614]